MNLKSEGKKQRRSRLVFQQKKTCGGEACLHLSPSPRRQPKSLSPAHMHLPGITRCPGASSAARAEPLTRARIFGLPQICLKAPLPRVVTPMPLPGHVPGTACPVKGRGKCLRSPGAAAGPNLTIPPRLPRVEVLGLSTGGGSAQTQLSLPEWELPRTGFVPTGLSSAAASPGSQYSLCACHN